LYHERRRATSDERRTHYQRIHFSSLTSFLSARLMPSDSKLSRRPLNKHIVQNSPPHYGCRPYFVLRTVEELTIDDGLTPNSTHRLIGSIQSRAAGRIRRFPPVCAPAPIVPGQSKLP
jgi:hypothetical protein